MSTIKVDGIRSNSATSDAITLASNGTCTANVTNNLSNRNKIINGAMAVSQRQTSRTGTGGGDGYFLCDRWRIFSANTSARFTISQATDTSGAEGFPNSFKFDCTTADTSLAASDFLGIQQKIEGQNVQDFLKGTSNAKKFTLSFYVKTNKLGVYTVELRDNDNSRQCSKTFTVANTNWNRYTLSYPADTTGVIDNNNGDSLQVNFWLIAGSTYTGGTLNSSGWASQTNANRVSSSNVNIGDSTDNNFELTGVQLEVDQTGSGVATDFEHRSYAQELALCQRYFQFIGSGFITSARGASSSMYLYSYTCPVNLRASPTVSTNNDLAHGTFNVRRYRDGTGISDSTNTPTANTSYFVTTNNTVHLQQDGFTATDDRSATIFLGGGAITLDSEL